MSNKSSVKQDLIQSILELRNQAESRLLRNKYYLAVRKLDELLEVLRPLDVETAKPQAAAAEAAPVRRAAEEPQQQRPKPEVVKSKRAANDAGRPEARPQQQPPWAAAEEGASAQQEAYENGFENGDYRQGGAEPAPLPFETAEEPFFGEPPARQRDTAWPRRNADYNA